MDSGIIPQADKYNTCLMKGFFRIICNMIKGNESDVVNTDFELQTKRVDKILMLFIVVVVVFYFNFRELFVSQQADVLLRWGLDQNVAF